MKFHEAIKTYDTTSSILEGDIESNNNKILTQAEVIEKLLEAVEQQSATIETIQEVHKVDSAGIQTVETECKAAAAAVAKRIPSGDIP